VALAQLVPLAQVERAIRQTPGVKAFEGWIVTKPRPQAGRARLRPLRRDRTGLAASATHAWMPTDFTVVALPADTKMLAPEMVKGRWLQPGDTNVLVANDRLAAACGLRAGRFGQRWRWDRPRSPGR
jgi:hypothetical protein